MTPPRAVVLAAIAAAVLTASVVPVEGVSAARSAAPAVPQHFAVHGSRSPYLTWTDSDATGYEVEQDAAANFHQKPITYSLRGTGTQLTPLGLAAGATSFFRIRARRGAAHSRWTSPVSVVVRGHEQLLSLMTYNILDANHAAQDSGHTIAPWSKRIGKAVALVKSVEPNVLTVQEGAPWVVSSGHTERQVDSFVSALGSPYKLARTEIPPGHPHYFRTGDYVIYDSTKLSPVGAGNHWNMGPRHAAYQEFAVNGTTAKVLVVSPHLIQNSGAKFDRERAAETRTLLKDANALANKRHVHVVFGGDFNSHLGKAVTFDGPGNVMRRHHLEDAQYDALLRRNAKYDSANQYSRRPPAAGVSVDHIFTSPGIGVLGYEVVLQLKDGRFVGTIPSDHNPLLALLTIDY